jgi:hypothetical protein
MSWPTKGTWFPVAVERSKPQTRRADADQLATAFGTSRARSQLTASGLETSDNAADLRRRAGEITSRGYVGPVGQYLELTSFPGVVRFFHAHSEVSWNRLACSTLPRPARSTKCRCPSGFQTAYPGRRQENRRRVTADRSARSHVGMRTDTPRSRTLPAELRACIMTPASSRGVPGTLFRNRRSRRTQRRGG